ncbi:MAG: hypothetical protein HZA48_04655 [Planctomycetes bacterium]|nr:hypothetical protein [Planctomycetota bacterium]
MNFFNVFFRIPGTKNWRGIAFAFALSILCASCASTSGAAPEINPKYVRISYYNNKLAGATPQTFTKPENPYTSAIIVMQTQDWLNKHMYARNPLQNLGAPLESVMDIKFSARLLEIMRDNGFFDMPAAEKTSRAMDVSKAICLETAEMKRIVAYESLVNAEQQKAFIDIGTAITAAFQASASPVIIKMEDPFETLRRYK